VSVDVHHVAEGGTGSEAVVLSGSLGSDLRMWDPQVGPLLDAGYRVIRYDHRGHGASPVPCGPYTLDDHGGDVLALLDRLGIERAHVVGLSLGGMTGMWLASRRPERVGRLVLCCTSARLGPARMWAERAEAVAASGTGSIADAVVQRWTTERWREANPDRVRELTAMVAATPDDGYVAACSAIQHMEMLDRLPSITAPTLVIAGADDQATPPEHGRAIVERIAGARLEVVDGAAHLGNIEQPERFNELIAAHLRGAA